MRYYILVAVAFALLALALPYIGVPTRDGELTIVMGKDGTLIPSTPRYERLPPRPYDIISGCEFPRLADDAKLVLLSTQSTESLSTTALANEQEIAVGAGTLTIEDGDKPLYIVLISVNATIWQVKGAVDRVRYLVLASEASNATLQTLNQPHTEVLVGATGIDADKVRFLQNKCLHYFKDNLEADLARDAMAHYVARKPDIVAGADHVNGFSAPSGAIDQTSARWLRLRTSWRKLAAFFGSSNGEPAEADLQYDMDRFYPGGVAEIDPKSVVSLQPASSYHVLPEEAGMLQLLRQGDLSPGTADGRSFDIVGGVRDDYSFVINRPIVFPAGLYGGHLRHFILRPGVPLPKGIVGHSCVRSQTTGQVLLSEGIC